MDKITDQGILDTTISRREFLAGTAGLSFSFALGAGLLGRATDAPAAGEALKMNAWGTIASDDTVTILTPGAEMGQGTMTSLPLILAEELDADWSKVKVEFAPPIPKLYGNPDALLNGGQASLASVAVAGYYMPLRMAGAQARRVLIDSVAQSWKVPAAELRTENGRVIHDKSGQRISYGEIARVATVPNSPPAITAADLKNPAELRLIGRKDIGRIDVPSKVNATAGDGI